MGPRATRTRWVVLAAVLGAVAVVAVLGIVVVLVRDDPQTRALPEGTTTTTEATGGSTTSTEPRPGPTEPDDVEVTERRVEVGGAQRGVVEIAPRPAPAGPVPAVVVLHGLGVDARAMSSVADWRGAVAEDGFVAVFPQGVADSWNLGPCCPPANLVGAADRAFLGQVTDELLERPSIDPRRVYLTGFSNGALMVYALACERPDSFAAIAPMAGTNLTGCEPAEPVSLLHQHSDPDLIVPYSGGLAVGSLLSSAPFPPVPDSVAAWAAADGCAPGPTVTQLDGVERFAWAGCAEGTRVELVRLPGRGHEWPRTDRYDGFDEMLRFFELR